MRTGSLPLVLSLVIFSMLIVVPSWGAQTYGVAEVSLPYRENSLLFYKRVCEEEVVPQFISELKKQNPAMHEGEVAESITVRAVDPGGKIVIYVETEHAKSGIAHADMLAEMALLKFHALDQAERIGKLEQLMREKDQLKAALGLLEKKLRPLEKEVIRRKAKAKEESPSSRIAEYQEELAGADLKRRELGAKLELLTKKAAQARDGVSAEEVVMLQTTAQELAVQFETSNEIREIELERLEVLVEQRQKVCELVKTRHESGLTTLDDLRKAEADLQLALHDYQLAKLSKIQLRQRLHLIQKELAKAKESLAETGGLALTAVIAERILECETEMAALEVKVADLKEKIEARRKEMKEIEEFVSLSARLEEQRAQIREMEGQIKKLEDEESTLARRMLDTRNFPNDRGRYIRVRSVDHIPAEQPGTFDVLGEVKNPGSQSLTEKTTLLKAIEGAGGFTENADQGRVVVIRRGGTRVSSRGPGGPPGRRTSAVERHVIDCGGLLGEEKGDDFTIEAGDMVIVPRKAESEGRPVAGSELERPRKFNIIGEVNKPGVYTLAPRTTVLRAIQTAGGFTRFSPRKVRVFRKVDDSVRRHEVDCAAILQGEAVDDFLIQPNDLLCVLRLE